MKGVCLKRMLALGGASILTILSTHAFASGFKLVFQSVSTMADQGDAAVVNDASTNWYNSAGLVYLPQQSVAGLFDVYAPSKFAGSSTAPNGNGIPALNFAGNGSATSYTNVELPLIHYAHPFRDRMAFGISVVPAWGLREEYNPNTVTRYDLTRIYTRSLAISPSVAMNVTLI